MGFMDDFRKGTEKTRGEGSDEKAESEKGWFGRLSTGKQVGLVCGGLIALVIVIAIGSGEEEQADTDTPVATEAKAIPGNEVRTEILDVESGVPDPYPGDDPIFNDNHDIYRVSVKVENGTGNRVAVDGYLGGPGGISVNSANLELVEPEAAWKGDLYFGWLIQDPAPTRLKIDDPQNAEVLYKGDISATAGS